MQPRHLLLFLFYFTLISNGFSVNVYANIIDNTYTVDKKTIIAEAVSAKPCHNNSHSNDIQENAGDEQSTILVCDCCEDSPCLNMDTCSEQLSSGITSLMNVAIPNKSMLWKNTIQVSLYLSMPKSPLDHKPKA